MSAIERIPMLITPEQITELVAVAVTSKTNELELVVAKAIEMMIAAPYLVDPSAVDIEALFNSGLKPSSIITRMDR